MPVQTKTTIAGKLNAGRLAINNTRADSEIFTLVSAYGYIGDKLQEGDTLHDIATIAVNTHTAAIGAQRETTLRAYAARKRARASYQALAQVARAVFAQDIAQRTKLGLTSSTRRGIAKFLTSAYTLFDNALNMTEIAQVLANYGYDTARLNSERGLIVAFDQANQAQVAAIGTTQQATREQQAALSTLNQWLARFMKIAHVALRDKPELIEKLGGLARSSRTPAQRGAAKKAAATRAAKQTENEEEQS